MRETKTMSEFKTTYTVTAAECLQCRWRTNGTLNELSALRHRLENSHKVRVYINTVIEYEPEPDPKE